MKRHVTYSQRARKLEKDMVATMTTTNFWQKARRALVPMRKALIDALLLGTLIVILFAYCGSVLLFTVPALLVLVYVFVLLIAFVLRLRQAALETGEPRNPYNYLFH